MTQGKCTHCRVRYTWKGLPRLRNAHCPSCGGRLYSTTYRLQWPVRNVTGHQVGQPRSAQ